MTGFFFIFAVISMETPSNPWCREIFVDQTCISDTGKLELLKKMNLRFLYGAEKMYVVLLTGMDLLYAFFLSTNILNYL